MKSSIKFFFQDKVFSVVEPKGFNPRKFCIVNVVLFLTIGGLLKILAINNYLKGKENSIYWDIWVILLVLGIVKLAFSDFKKTGRFLLLTIYAQNRALLCMVLLAIIFFPVELIFLNTAENYMKEGFYYMSTAIKSIAYLYFYFLFVQLFYRAVLKKKAI